MAERPATEERAVSETEGLWVEQAGETRPRARNWAATVVAAAMVAALLAATAAGFRFVQSDPLPAAYADPVIAVQPDDDRPWPAAEIKGTLRQEGGCLLVDDAVAMFPDGTAWAQPARLIFADGTVWRIGQRIVGGGGFISAESVTGTDLGDEATAAAAACADDLGLTAVVQVMP